MTQTKNTTSGNRKQSWPVALVRRRPRWYPSRQRLIGMVRCSGDNFVLPPAIVRKAAWRD